MNTRVYQPEPQTAAQSPVMKPISIAETIDSNNPDEVQKYLLYLMNYMPDDILAENIDTENQVQTGQRFRWKKMIYFIYIAITAVISCSLGWIFGFVAFDLKSLTVKIYVALTCALFIQILFCVFIPFVKKIKNQFES